MRLTDQLPSLARAASACAGIPELEVSDLEILPTSGLAHDHVRCRGLGLLLRVPRQSQLALDAEANLTYQATCFRRMGASGHTPKLFGVIDPSEAVPMGALIVEEIVGAPASLPTDLRAVARALASVHALAVPPESARAPLKDPPNPVVDTLGEVRAQAVHLADPFAPVTPEARAAIEAEVDAMNAFADRNPPPPKTLTSFDAHPGNFIVQPAGRAMLVDLEKGRYGGAGFDLAHATLYTSTTWDVATYSELSAEEVASFYAAWLSAVPEEMAQSYRSWLLPMRRIMWLWSVTWCAKWAVESRRDQVVEKHAASSTEDWSAENTDRALIEHVADRVRTYLSDEIVARVRKEWRTDNALASLLRTD